MSKNIFERNEKGTSGEPVSKNQQALSNARVSLLLVVAMSVINIFSLIFADRYFLFSSYISLQFSISGMVFYLETMEILYAIVGGVLAFAVVIPYLLSWIFSKKHPVWLIIATVLFSIDTLLFLLDFFGFFLAGDYSMVLDLLMHAYVLYCLIAGIKPAYELRREAAAANNSEASATEAIGEAEEMAESASDTESESKDSESAESSDSDEVKSFYDFSDFGESSSESDGENGQGI